MSNGLYVTSIIMIICLVIIQLIFALLLYRKYQEDKSLQMFLGVTLLFILFSIDRTLFFIYDYYLTGFNSDLVLQYFVFWKIANLFEWLGIFFFIFFAERTILQKKTKYIFSIAYIIVIIISVSLPTLELMEPFMIIAPAIGIPFIPLSYMYVAIKSEAKVRQKAILIVLGFILFFIGHGLLNNALLEGIGLGALIEQHYLMYMISVSFKLCAIALLGYGYLSKLM